MNAGLNSSGQVVGHVDGTLWAVCRCQHCERSAQWWLRAYGRKVWAGQADPLSPAAIASYCSMIMNNPLLQGSVNNTGKLKTSQFLRDLHTHPPRSSIKYPFSRQNCALHICVLTSSSCQVDGLAWQRFSLCAHRKESFFTSAYERLELKLVLHFFVF